MMNWVQEMPTRAGVYWYRRDQRAQPGEYEVVQIGRDDRKRGSAAMRVVSGTDALDSLHGEWYGPLSPPGPRTAVGTRAGAKGNARIIVRLRNGGSFCVEWVIPEGDADTLSRKLKELRAHGESIPAHLRTKMSALMQALMKFAAAPARGHA